MKEDPRQQLKEKKKKEICSLLDLMGPMEIDSIAAIIEGISRITALRYLDELLAAGYVRKIHSPGKRKNIYAYEFQSDCNPRGDIVSSALANPMHQIALLFVRAGR